MESEDYEEEHVTSHWGGAAAWDEDADGAAQVNIFIDNNIYLLTKK